MKHISRLASLVALGVFVPTIANAQVDYFADMGATKQPWENFKLNAKTTVKLDFRNASVDAVLKVFSDASGVAILKDPALVGGLSIQSPKPQNLKDAFAMLNSALGLRNFEIKKDGILSLKLTGVVTPVAALVVFPDLAALPVVIAAQRPVAWAALTSQS